MIDAVGHPQRILLLGGASEIGLAIVEEYLAQGPCHVVLSARPGGTPPAAAIERLEAKGADVRVIALDALAFDTHQVALESAFVEGDVDVAIVAFGVLGDAEEAWQDQATALNLAQTNYTAGVSVGVILGKLLRKQGHGQLIALSSVAGERVRRSNFVYGSAKAGFDGFYRNLGEALRGDGINVLVVRPGMVTTKMTSGMRKAPLTVDAETVGRAAVRGAKSRKSVVWVPPLFQLVMLVIKHIPQPIFRHLPF